MAAAGRSAGLSRAPGRVDGSSTTVPRVNRAEWHLSRGVAKCWDDLVINAAEAVRALRTRGDRKSTTWLPRVITRGAGNQVDLCVATPGLRARGRCASAGRRRSSRQRDSYALLTNSQPGCALIVIGPSCRAASLIGATRPRLPPTPGGGAVSRPPHQPRGSFAGGTGSRMRVRLGTRSAPLGPTASWTRIHVRHHRERPGPRAVAECAQGGVTSASTQKFSPVPPVSG
jgi:hypothetical protein